MGRRTKVMGICLIALLSTAAVAVSTASAAEPELYECSKTAKVGKGGTGRFNDKRCSVENAEHKGKYELQPGIGKGKAFKGFDSGEVEIHVPRIGGSGLLCRSGRDKGKFTSPTTVGDVVLELGRCNFAGRGPCLASGSESTIVKSNPLSGRLGYISKSPVRVGMSLGAEGPPFPPLFCGGIVAEITGSVIGEVTGNVNTLSRHTEDVFALNGSGLQQVDSFEGGPEEVLFTTINGPPPEASGLQSTIRVSGEELELKA
jgi:hypothetical protein